MQLLARRYYSESISGSHALLLRMRRTIMCAPSATSPPNDRRALERDPPIVFLRSEVLADGDFVAQKKSAPGLDLGVHIPRITAA